MPFLKNPKLEVAVDGFTITYDYFDKRGPGTFDDMERLGDQVEVFKTSEGTKALKRLEFLAKAPNNLNPVTTPTAKKTNESE